MISFAHVWNLFRFAWVFELIAWSVMSSLSSFQKDIIRFLWAVNTFVISWRIYSIDFFCIFFIFFLSAIFIMTSHLLRSDDNSSLRRCFLIVTSSFIMFAHDMILDEKRMLSCVCMLSCICSCLLSSCTNVFNFYTFFVMNAFWFSLFLSSESFWRCCINFTVTSFHEWFLLFSFSNVDVCIKRSIMLATYFLLLHELFNFTLLFLCDKSTLLDWSSSWVSISIFWFNSSTRYQSSDLTWILDFNILTRSDIDLESILNSSSRLDSSRNRKWRQES